MTLYPWLVDVIIPLSNALQAERLHHGILLQGQPGMGKTALISIMANGLVCDQTPDLTACGGCKPCVLFNAGNHPDSLFITSEGSSIGVDEIRKGSLFVQKTSQISRRRVIVINQAQKLTEPAANALLKTLEEPNPQVYLLLGTDEPGRMLATITSRCF
ncbi:MAG: DNA polymerase-3 subunit delta', partial [Alteromonadaceae bacterium]